MSSMVLGNEVMCISNERHNLTDGEGWFKHSGLGIAALGFRIAVMFFFFLKELSLTLAAMKKINNWKTYLFAVDTECANFF